MLHRLNRSRTVASLSIGRLITCMALMAFASFGCSDADDLLDLALSPPDRKPIDTARTGVNNFFVNREFGTIGQQHREISDTLRLDFVRVLFAWTDDVQPTPNSPVGYSFFEQILDQTPEGQDVLVVLAHTPSWMANPANWINGNPRETWVKLWLEPTVAHLRNRPRIVGWEVWNEPDRTVVASDAALELTNPANYVDLLTRANRSLRQLDPARLVVMAASESINQDFPNKLNYNKSLRDLGAENFTDIWNIHYYSTNFESLISNGGIADFLNSLIRPIWVTESGEQGPNNQLAYVETVWPYLWENVPGIDRIYYFEFGSTAPIENNFGLRTTNAAFPVSDLYVYLRDR